MAVREQAGIMERMKDQHSLSEVTILQVYTPEPQPLSPDAEC